MACLPIVSSNCAARPTAREIDCQRLGGYRTKSLGDRIGRARCRISRAGRGKLDREAPALDARHVSPRRAEALDAVRKSEYHRLSGRDRRYIKGQKYMLLSHRENLTLEGKRALKTLLAANKRLNTAYLLKESFGQLWDYNRKAWARKFFENWRASLKWQRLKPFEK